MRKLKVCLGKRSYEVLIGRGAVKALGRAIVSLGLGSDAYVVTNEYLRKKYGASVRRILGSQSLSVRFKEVPATEKAKSLDWAYSLIRDIARYDKNRKVVIVAFGGGVIGDLSGFVASIYKRGVPYVQVPTTLLAQVDSSIGGKTAVDLTQGKNLAGAFYQPRLVVSDLDFLGSLDLRQFRSGMSEVIKCALIRDTVLFSFLERKTLNDIRSASGFLEYVISRAAGVKARIVGQDEREEKGVRTLLNFGHTLGHAIEAAADYGGYTHGEAVGLGMLLASDLSFELGILKPQAHARIAGVLKKYGLPVRIGKIPLEKIIRLHYRDKKFKGARNRFVLLEGIGRPVIKEGLPLELIRKVVSRRF